MTGYGIIAAATAANAGIYAWSGNPINLACAVFAGLYVICMCIRDNRCKGCPR